MAIRASRWARALHADELTQVVRESFEREPGHRHNGGTRHGWRRCRVVAVLAALCIGAVTGSSAQILPSDSFYVPPNPLPPGNPGDVIRSRTILAPLFPNAVTRQIMYRSTTVSGKAVAVTGVVVTPLLPAAGRPLVVLTPGTRGTGDQCAPSKQFGVTATPPRSARPRDRHHPATAGPRHRRGADRLRGRRHPGPAVVPRRPVWQSPRSLSPWRSRRPRAPPIPTTRTSGGRPAAPNRAGASTSRTARASSSRRSSSTAPTASRRGSAPS